MAQIERAVQKRLAAWVHPATGDWTAIFSGADRPASEPGPSLLPIKGGQCSGKDSAEKPLSGIWARDARARTGFRSGLGGRRSFCACLRPDQGVGKAMRDLIREAFGRRP
jgi:hypothetical protein